jgi:LysR family glycine cleavage system transcriptional activator
MRAFESAARHLSFKAAANDLHVTPAAISQQIKLLEEYLGQPLFHRLPRALTLTRTAEAMLPKLREGLDCLAAAVAATRIDQPGGVIKVLAPPSFAARWLVPRLAKFQQAHPDCELRLSSDATAIDRRDAGALTQDEHDPLDQESRVMIRFGHGRYAGHRVERLFAPDYVPVCSPTLASGDHPLKTPDEVRHHPLIHDETIADLEERPSWTEWLRRAGVSGVDEQRGPRFNNQALAIEAAMAGQGMLLVPRVLVSADVAAGRLAIPFEIIVPSRYAYYLVSSPALAERPAVRAFADWLFAEARADGLLN